MPAHLGNRNVRSTLKRRTQSCSPMSAYDRLPLDLRNWLAQAALPWSARSAYRLWRKLYRMYDGDIHEVRSELTRIERKRLSRDARQIWGEEHPAAQEI